MKEFEINMTATSKKTFRLRAETCEDAHDVVSELLEHSDLLEFTDADVDEVDVSCTEVTEDEESPCCHEIALGKSPFDEEMEQLMNGLLKGIPAISGLDKFYRTLEDLCLPYGDEDDIREEIDNISSFDDFEPLLHLDFGPICALETEGSDDCFPNRRRNRLFGKNGCLLDTSLHSGVSALSTVAESYELWLLEDMTLAVTFCCSMTVKGDDGYTESVTFRYPVSGSYPELSGDFDAVDFLVSIEDLICEALGLD